MSLLTSGRGIWSSEINTVEQGYLRRPLHWDREEKQTSRLRGAHDPFHEGEGLHSAHRAERPKYMWVFDVLNKGIVLYTFTYSALSFICSLSTTILRFLRILCLCSKCFFPYTVLTLQGLSGTASYRPWGPVPLLNATSVHCRRRNAQLKPSPRSIQQTIDLNFNYETYVSTIHFPLIVSFKPWRFIFYIIIII